MKLPGWIASMFTGLATVTVQVGANCTTWLPVGVCTLSVVSVAVSTFPRTTVGVGGAWAATVVATRARAALSARAAFITLDCDARRGGGSRRPFYRHLRCAALSARTALNSEAS